MTMKTLTRFIFSALTLMMLLGLAQPAQAQRLVDNTTLSAAITTPGQTVISLASVTCTGCTFGQDTVIYTADGEAMVVTGAYAAGGGALTVPVRRGQLGTVASPHANGAVVYVGPQNRFHLGNPGGFSADPSGPCTRGIAAAGVDRGATILPWINVIDGNIWNCDGASHWVGINKQRLTYNSEGPLGPQ